MVYNDQPNSNMNTVFNVITNISILLFVVEMNADNIFENRFVFPLSSNPNHQPPIILKGY